MTEPDVQELHNTFLNSSYIDIIQSLGHGKNFTKAMGTKLYDDDNVEYTDFLSGYGVHNIGHNNQALVAHLHSELDTDSPTYLNIDIPDDSAILAKHLSGLTLGQLPRVSFANSGSEVVEVALKTAAAATKRSSFVSCNNCYHGLSTGALSLMDDTTMKKPFGDLLTDVHHVEYGNLQQLEATVKEVRPAAFIVEPIQSEGGIVIPSEDYLLEASRICKRYNTCLIIDEIQTGIGRCGTMLRTDFSKVVPDMLLLGKALGGGVLPISACIMSEKLYKKAHHGFDKCFLYNSTFAGGHLPSQCAIKTLEIIENSTLLHDANENGVYLLGKLKQLQEKHDIIDDTRGAGLLVGIEFKKARGILSSTLPAKLKESFFTYLVTAKLMQDYKMILQVCTHHGGVMRIEPPLTISKEEIDRLIQALDTILTEIPNHTVALNKLIKYKVFKREF